MGSFFSYHVEDDDLASINVHHYGAPKIWISVSERNYKPFIKYLRFVNFILFGLSDYIKMEISVFFYFPGVNILISVHAMPLLGIKVF